MEISIRKSLENIIHFGDTDIFPFPFERNLFEEKIDECESLLKSIDKDFEFWLSTFPPLVEVQLLLVLMMKHLALPLVI